MLRAVFVTLFGLPAAPAANGLPFGPDLDNLVVESRRQVLVPLSELAVR